METFSSAPITKIPGSISSVLDLEHQINDKCEKGFGWTQAYIMHRHLLTLLQACSYICICRNQWDYSEQSM